MSGWGRVKMLVFMTSLLFSCVIFNLKSAFLSILYCAIHFQFGTLAQERISELYFAVHRWPGPRRTLSIVFPQLSFHTYSVMDRFFQSMLKRDC